VNNDIIVDVQGLHRSFGRKIALTDVSFQIPSGSVFGLVGENGAGKTTLIKHVLGLYRPQIGSVLVFGKSPVEDPVSVLGQIGYLSEDREMPNWMTVAQLMAFAKPFYPNWDDKFAEELREMFELAAGQKVNSLSRGQRARILLLQALAHRPPLLLLDEPSSGLDPIVRREIITAIIRTVSEEGRTILFSSHLLDEVQRVSDRVAMLHEGRLVMCDSLENILESHYRFTVRFEELQEQMPAMPGVLQMAGEGHEWTVYCNGRRDEFLRELSSRQAAIVEEGKPTLEEIFVVHAKTGEAAK
jgi:ABC-type multidrug transport system ATPase subunit